MSLPAPTTQVVAVCQGHRCRALLAAQRPDGMAALRDAVRDSAHGLLLSTACVGTCAHGPVATVGTGHDVGSTRAVVMSVLLGPLQQAHVDGLGDYLRAGVSEPLPDALHDVRLIPAVQHR